MLFTFKNTNINKFNCMLIDPLPNIIRANKLQEHTTIIGNNTVFTTTNHIYEPYEMEFNFICQSPKMIDDISQLFDGVGDLVWERETNRILKATVIGGINYNTIKDNYILFSILFLVEPLKRNNDKEELITMIKQGVIINNLGTTPCLPLITVYGNGTCNIDISNQQLTINNVVGYVTINNEIADVYKDNISFNHNTTGNIPILLPVGRSVASYSGGVTKLTIQKNERWL